MRPPSSAAWSPVVANGVANAAIPAERVRALRARRRQDVAGCLREGRASVTVGADSGGGGGGGTAPAAVTEKRTIDGDRHLHHAYGADTQPRAHQHLEVGRHRVGRGLVCVDDDGTGTRWQGRRLRQPGQLRASGRAAP